MDASSNFLPREYSEMNLSVRLFDPEEIAENQKGSRTNDKSDNELLKFFFEVEIISRDYKLKLKIFLKTFNPFL